MSDLKFHFIKLNRFIIFLLKNQKKISQNFGIYISSCLYLSRVIKQLFLLNVFNLIRMKAISIITFSGLHLNRKSAAMRIFLLG